MPKNSINPKFLKRQDIFFKDPLFGKRTVEIFSTLILDIIFLVVPLWQNCKKKTRWLLKLNTSFITHLRMSKKHLKILLILSGLFLAVLSLGKAEKDRAYEILNRWYLIPKEESFTELYFEDQFVIPQELTAGETISFAFTIRNNEGMDKEYPYTIYLQNENEAILIGEGIISIKNAEEKTSTFSYTFIKEHEKETMFVALPEQGQKIHFLLANNF